MLAGARTLLTFASRQTTRCVLHEPLPVACLLATYWLGTRSGERASRGGLGVMDGLPPGQPAGNSTQTEKRLSVSSINRLI